MLDVRAPCLFTSGNVHADIGRHSRALWGGGRLRGPDRRSVAGAGQDKADHLEAQGRRSCLDRRFRCFWGDLKNRYYKGALFTLQPRLWNAAMLAAGAHEKQGHARNPKRNKGMPPRTRPTGGAEPAASKRAGTFAARLTYCRERLLYDFCKGGSLRNEPQYPAMGYALHSGRGGSDSEDEKRGGAFSGSFEEEEEE